MMRDPIVIDVTTLKGDVLKHSLSVRGGVAMWQLVQNILTQDPLQGSMHAHGQPQRPEL